MIPAFLQACDESMVRTVVVLTLVEGKKLPTIIFEVMLVLRGGLSFDLKKEFNTI